MIDHLKKKKNIVDQSVLVNYSNKSNKIQEHKSNKKVTNNSEAWKNINKIDNKINTK